MKKKDKKGDSMKKMLLILVLGVSSLMADSDYDYEKDDFTYNRTPSDLATQVKAERAAKKINLKKVEEVKKVVREEVERTKKPVSKKVDKKKGLKNNSKKKLAKKVVQKTLSPKKQEVLNNVVSDSEVKLQKDQKFSHRGTLLDPSESGHWFSGQGGDKLSHDANPKWTSSKRVLGRASAFNKKFGEATGDYKISHKPVPSKKSPDGIKKALFHTEQTQSRDLTRKEVRKLVTNDDTEDQQGMGDSTQGNPINNRRIL